jgi:hypothetical protein|tara:strand:- start:2609 stop:4057 length:1449 start_codon:yes stop_codon:yes gene_type:complete
MNDKINKAPVTYEDWIDLGRVIIPCDTKQAVVEKWSDPDFKITKEEWRIEHATRQIGLRLDQYIDFDIDNPIVKKFVADHIKSCGAIFGRKNNPSSHYLWSGTSDYKKFSLPKELENYYKDYNHGATLCEIRHGANKYTLVPETKYHSTNETVKWVKYDGIDEYSGNLKTDLGKIALSTALCITYAGSGQRDDYCTAIAGVLLKHTEWSTDEIDEFIYKIAVVAKDEECHKRKGKGTSHKKANRKFGMPKLAEIIGCSTKTIATLFSWIGVQEATSEEAKQSIGQIIEYGSDRYFVKINAVVQGEAVEKTITVDGPTLRNKKLFYDAVISKASVWIPEMKPADFEEIMRRKYEAREKSKDYVEDAQEDLRFKKHFDNYIAEDKAYTTKKELAYSGLPYFNIEKKILEFNLDRFEDYLHRQKVNLARVDLVIKCQQILKAKKNHGKFAGKSCVSWRILNRDVDKDDLIIEGVYNEIKQEITND